MNYLLFAALLVSTVWLAILAHNAKKRRRNKLNHGKPAFWAAEIPSLDIYDEFPATYQDTCEMMVASQEEIEDESAAYAMFVLYGIDNPAPDLVVTVTSPVNTVTRFIPDFEEGALVGVKVAPK